MTNSVRLGYVDIAKGIGILLVVCSHTDAMEMMLPMQGMFVPIFYFCSGYTFSSKNTFSNMMKNKFRKLIFPYLFFNTVMFLVFWHFSIREVIGVVYSRYCLFPLDIIPNIKFLTSGNYPMWFLTSMFVSFLLFYFIVYFENYKSFIIIAYSILTVLLMHIPILLPWSIDTAFLTSLFMYVGLKFRKKGGVDCINKYLVLLAAIIYYGLQFIDGDINLSVRMYGTSLVYYVMLGILGSIVVLWVSKRIETLFIGRVLGMLGKNSLTIFCIEMIFIVWAKYIYKWLFPGAVLGNCVGIFEIVLALLGGCIVSVLIKKNKILSRIAYGS